VTRASGGPANVTGIAGAANTGDGGGVDRGGSLPRPGRAGGSGIVVLRYPSAQTITIGAGLTGSTTTSGSDSITTITQGTGNVSWT
jgi:hypothetical protein